jgi:hypothetical protein
MTRVREAMYRFTNRQQYLDLIERAGKIRRGRLRWLEEYQLTPAQTEKYSSRTCARHGSSWRRPVTTSTGVEMSTITACATTRDADLPAAGVAGRDEGEDRADAVCGVAEPEDLTGNWEAWYSQHPTYDTPHLYLRLQHTKTGSVHAYNGLKDPAVDAMIEKSEVTLDKNERIKLIKDIQIALLEKYTPFVITHNYSSFVARWKYVKDYEVNPAATAQPTYQTQIWMDKHRWGARRAAPRAAGKEQHDVTTQQDTIPAAPRKRCSRPG